MKVMKHQKLMGEFAVDRAPFVYGMTICKDEMFRWNHWIWTPFWSIWSFEVPHLPSLMTRWWWMWAMQWNAFVRSSHLADSGCMPNIYWHTGGFGSKRLGMFLVESITKKMRGSWRLGDFQDLEIKEWWLTFVQTRLAMTSWPVIHMMRFILCLGTITLWSMDLEKSHHSNVTRQVDIQVFGSTCWLFIYICSTMPSLGQLT